jgi:hypothetical protein
VGKEIKNVRKNLYFKPALYNSYNEYLTPPSR